MTEIVLITNKKLFISPHLYIDFLSLIYIREVHGLCIIQVLVGIAVYA